MADRVWSPRVTVAVIVEEDGRFLFVEELVDGRAVLNQPAGHLEPGEGLLDAARRESLEETAWPVEPTALVGIYRWVRGGGETFLRFCFAARLAGERLERPLDPDIQRTLWLAPGDLSAERVRSPLVRRSLDDYLAGARHSLCVVHDMP